MTKLTTSDASSSNPMAEAGPAEGKVEPGLCSCDCPGCDMTGMHCGEAARGCGYKITR